MKYASLLLVAILMPVLVSAQAPLPKREFRAAWVATVFNIDFPSKATLTPTQQRAEFVSLISAHQAAGLNAVVVQVRGACDAFYPSPLEPWSEYLNGKQGQAPQPLYDPLAFMIAECHQRGMEFHAWFNPYRAVLDVTNAKIDSTRHVAVLHPEWLLPYDKLRILDPGLAEVRSYVIQVVMDVVRRYDLDGVHFDDYFYPYPKPGFSLNDDASFQKDPRGFVSRADWRRDNINLLIRQVHDSIQAVKPWVKFGVSPFGIWQNQGAAQPLGSPTNGTQSYHDVYCDARLWAQQSWVDYLAPQLYWHIGFSAADYGKLAPWWSQNAFGRNLYIGQAAYRVNTATAAWQQADQIPNQLRLNRELAGVQGSIFYNTNTLLKNPLGLLDSLKRQFYLYPSLQPRMPWKDSIAPPKPLELVAMPDSKGVLLTWKKPSTGSGALEKVRQYAIYRFLGNAPLDLGQASALYAITPNDTTAWLDAQVPPQTRLRYVVTALDRLHNESPASNEAPVEGLSTSGEALLAQTQLSCHPNPAVCQTTLSYRLPAPTTLALQILDLNGRIVWQRSPVRQAAGEQAVILDTGGWLSGIYVVALHTGYGVKTLRVVVQ